MSVTILDPRVELARLPIAAAMAAHEAVAHGAQCVPSRGVVTLRCVPHVVMSALLAAGFESTGARRWRWPAGVDHGFHSLLMGPAEAMPLADEMRAGVVFIDDDTGDAWTATYTTEAMLEKEWVRT